MYFQRIYRVFTLNSLSFLRNCIHLSNHAFEIFWKKKWNCCRRREWGIYMLFIIVNFLVPTYGSYLPLLAHFIYRFVASKLRHHVLKRVHKDFWFLHHAVGSRASEALLPNYFLPACLPTYLPTYLPTFLPTDYLTIYYLSTKQATFLLPAYLTT